MKREVEGITVDGVEVIVTHDPDGPKYINTPCGTFAVQINGVERIVSRVDVLADGGTILHLKGGANILFPRHKDLAPSYNGKEIRSAK